MPGDVGKQDADAPLVQPATVLLVAGGQRGDAARCRDLGIAAYLTEIILLGCVALRVGKKLEWDGPNMRAKNAPEAAKFVKREYRKGWKLA